MAEFQDVMKQAQRMCKEHDKCGDCALREMADKAGIYCPIQTMRKLDAAKVEAAVMDWAAMNPEPRYPTWVEWWNENFSSKGRRMLTPCSFVPPAELGCSIGMDGCMNAPYKCWHTPIPADIAEKLGIKPVGGSDNG